jgi:tight adherence protein C
VILTLLIGLIFTGIAVALIAQAVIAARLRAVETLGQIGHYGFTGGADLEPSPGLRGMFNDVASGIGTLVVEHMHLFNEELLRKQLIQAGMYRTSPRMLMGYQVLGVLAFPALWIWFAVGTGVNTAFALMGVLVAGLIGWMGPTSAVRRKADARLYRIDYDMPELIDLLVVTVEGGLSLNASLQLASERIKGPLGDELRIAIQEQRMGLSQLQALENLQSRVPTPAVRSFVRAMVQGERLGVSIGQILRSLALEMRKRRRAAAEERAQKAPIKILFPLVFMIFPAMFVVILGPAVISVFNAFNG